MSVEKEKDAARTAARAELLKADIVGIRLGMTLAEAEQLIRGRMKLRGVASSKPPSNSVVGGALWIKNPRIPYSEFRTFVSADGEEEIVLFFHLKVSDRVLGVARRVQLQAGVTDEMVIKQLQEKYGRAPLVIGKPSPTNGFSTWLAWVVDFGRPIDRDCGADLVCAWSRDVCRTDLSSVANWYLSIVEPEADAGKVMSGAKYPKMETLWLETVGAVSSDSWDNRTWDAAKWRGCGPSVLAGVAPNHKPPVLDVAIFDLATYAEIYLKAIPDPKLSEGKPPDL